MRRWTLIIGQGACAAVLGWGLAGLQPVDAIELHPTDQQIADALARGRQAAESRTPPDQLYVWFGPVADLEPRGFLMTKLTGLAVMSAHFALRAEHPTGNDLSQILTEPTLLISVLVYGDQPDFAMDSYMLLMQESRSIKPVKVRFDARANRSSAWPHRPAYRAKVVASFPYDELDPKAKAILTVFPGRGGAVSFDLDFSHIE